MNVEQGTFTPLVYSTSGGLANECQTFYRQLANKIATKTNDKSPSIFHRFTGHRFGRKHRFHRVTPVHQITSATVVTTVLPVLPLLLNFYHYFASPTIQQFYQ